MSTRPGHGIFAISGGLDADISASGGDGSSVGAIDGTTFPAGNTAIAGDAARWYKYIVAGSALWMFLVWRAVDGF